MKRWIVFRWIVALMIGLFAGVSAGAGDVQALWSVDAGVSVALGQAAYDLEDEMGSDTLMSRLEFPLDGWAASGRVLCSVTRGDGESWRFSLEAEVGMTDPAGLMRDYDWVEPSGFPKVPFSYTESAAEALSFSAAFKASGPIIHRDRLGLYWFAGYRFGYEFQSIRGYEGWQYVWNDTALAYDLYLIWSSSEALRYTLYSHALPVGLGVRMNPWTRLHLDLEAAWVPLYVADEDDHILRNKLSTASGVGAGGSGRLEAVLLLSRRGDGTGPYLSLAVELFGWRVFTTQTQEWYGDDPAGPGDETGMVISGIGHEISSWELRTVLGAGLRF